MSQLMKPCPGSSVTTQTQSTLQTQCTNTLFLVGHIPNRSKPQKQWFPRVLKYCSCCYCGLKTTACTVIQFTTRQLSFFSLATRTPKSIGASNLKQILSASIFGCKFLFKLYNCSWVLFHLYAYYM